MLNRFYAWFTRFSLAGEHGGGKGLRKKPLKSETVIYTYVSIIKQHWRKMTIQNFVRKVKTFVRKLLY